MKKLLFTILTASLVLLVSCGGPSAIEFNDSLVKEQTKLGSTITATSAKLGMAVANNNQDEIKITIDSLTSQVDRSIATVKGLSVPSGGEKFKEAAITYFESFKRLAELGTITDTVNFVDTFTSKSQEIEKDITDKENAFLQAQKAFAKDKGMELR